VGVGNETTTLATDSYFNFVTSLQSTLNSPTPKWQFIIANKAGDPSVQEIYTGAGNLYRDNTTYKTGATALRTEPTDANEPIQAIWQIFAPTGELVVVSGYLRKDTNYGSTNRPTVTLSGLGITASTYTLTDVDDTWEQFTVSGTQTTGTDGILTLTVSFQSGAANAKAWIDGIVAPTTVAVNSGDFGFWSSGQPAQLLASNFVSALDIWNTLTSQLTLTGSAGKLMTDKLTPMTYTKSNELDSNVQSVNDVTLVGDGTTTPMGA